jgi:hypothetical protein
LCVQFLFSRLLFQLCDNYFVTLVPNTLLKEKSKKKTPLIDKDSILRKSNRELLIDSKSSTSHSSLCQTILSSLEKEAKGEI